MLDDIDDVRTASTDGGLQHLMDHNGILWDEEDQGPDMDTLPNVSDSELGRVGFSDAFQITFKIHCTQIKNKIVDTIF